MSLSDFFWINQQGLIGVAIATLVIIFLAKYMANHLEPDEAKVVFWVRNLILILVFAGYAIALMMSANISLNHSTIDRSAGDDAQRRFEQKLQ